MKKKLSLEKFTVVVLCQCGCDEVYTYEVMATDTASAINESQRSRKYDGLVVAVIGGHHKNHINGKPLEMKL